METANEAQLRELKALSTTDDTVQKIDQTMAIYGALDIKAKATDKMNEYHDMAMENLAHIALPEEKKTPLRDLAEFLLGREH